MLFLLASILVFAIGLTLHIWLDKAVFFCMTVFGCVSILSIIIIFPYSREYCKELEFKRQVLVYELLKAQKRNDKLSYISILERADDFNEELNANLKRASKILYKDFYTDNFRKLRPINTKNDFFNMPHQGCCAQNVL